MISEFGPHLDWPDLKLHFLQFLNRQVAWELAQADGEKRRLHLAGQNLCQTSASAFITQNADEILLVVRGRKERQSLDMVPVSMRDQKSQLHRARPEFFVQSETKQANPGAGIEN